MSNKIWTMTYNSYYGIIMELDEDLQTALNEVIPNVEFSGKVKITMEYIPSEDENG